MRLGGAVRVLERPVTLAAVVLLALATGAQLPLGTAFTYQGRLADAGSPANGLYDLRFELFAQAAGGAPVGTLPPFTNVMVSGGLFTVTLDFGAAFAGDARWLEIGARPGGTSGSFVVLTPRQALRPTPNAIYSQAVPWTGVIGRPAELVPTGAVMFFDLTACPAGWTSLAEAQGRTIVGLGPGGSLRGGWPTLPGGGLADEAPRTIMGASAVPEHTHAVTNTAHDEAAFDTVIGGTHTHTATTDTAGNHSHSLSLGTGDDNTTDRAQYSESAIIVLTVSTSSAGAHSHGVTVDTAGSSHQHSIDVPSHTHAATASTTGNSSVDVTMPYVQLLVCRKG
jgi:hypothetical protein